MHFFFISGRQVSGRLEHKRYVKGKIYEAYLKACIDPCRLDRFDCQEPRPDVPQFLLGIRNNSPKIKCT